MDDLQDVDDLVWDLFIKLFPRRILSWDTSSPTLKQLDTAIVLTKSHGNIRVSIANGKAFCQYYIYKPINGIMTNHWRQVEINLSDPDSIDRLRAVVEN